MAASIIIFIAVYFFIATEKLDKTIAVIIGATLMIGLQLLSFHQAVEAIDLNVIFLLTGMNHVCPPLFPAENGHFHRGVPAGSHADSPLAVR